MGDFGFSANMHKFVNVTTSVRSRGLESWVGYKFGLRLEIRPKNRSNSELETPVVS